MACPPALPVVGARLARGSVTRSGPVANKPLLCKSHDWWHARFYATGTIVGAFGAPLLFGALIESGDPDAIFVGYVIGAVAMIIGGVIQATMGVEAAQRDLEDIAPPLSATEAELEEPGEEADPCTLGRGEGRETAHAPRFEREQPPARPRTGGDR